MTQEDPQDEHFKRYISLAKNERMYVQWSVNITHFKQQKYLLKLNFIIKGYTIVQVFGHASYPYLS